MRSAQLTAAVLAPHVKGSPKPESYMLYPESRFYSKEQIWKARLQRLSQDTDE